MAEVRVNSVRQEKLVTFTLFINVLIMVMNTSMFTVAIPEIIEKHQLSPSLAAWMVTSYSVCFAVGTLLYGRLTVLFTIPTLLTVGLSLLGMGSILGMLAEAYSILVIARVIQAIGTSAISALGVVMISRYFPVVSRNKALALIASASALGFGLGPLIGGMISNYVGWRYLFAVSVIGAVTIPVYRRYIPSRIEGRGRFDHVGFLLFSVSILSPLIAVSTGFFWFLIGVFCFPLFLAHIKKINDPFLAPSLLQDQVYTKALFLAFSMFFIHFSVLFMTPLLLKNVHGENVLSIGFIIFIGALGSTMIMRVLGEYVDSIGLPVIVGISAFCMIISTFLFSGFSDRNPILVILFYFISSTGFSCISMGLSNFMTRYLHADRVTAGYGTLQLIQFFGGAFGVAVMGELLDTRFMRGIGWNMLWTRGGAVYSNAYLVLFVLALTACVTFICFYNQTKGLPLKHPPNMKEKKSNEFSS